MKAVLEQRMDLFLELLEGRRDREDELVFTEEVLGERPLARIIDEIRAAAVSSEGFELLERRQLDRNTIGAWLRAKRDRSLWILRVGVEVAPSRRIEEFSLTASEGPRVDPDEAWRVFDGLVDGSGFTVGCFAGELGPDGALREIHSKSGDDRLAIGTLGMIWAHAALAEWIAEGGATWDDPLMIDESLRCLPESRTSVLAPGEILPLKTHARRALVEADNTAAEHLAAMLGRERIERARDRLRAEANTRDEVTDGEPFLTPAEMYRLKCGATSLVNRYAAAANDERRRMLEEDVPKSDVSAALFLTWDKPQQIGRVGWHASAREMCMTLAGLWGACRERKGCEAASLLTSTRTEHKRDDGCVSIALAGGEPGAIAAAWLRERPDGRVIVLAVIINDPATPIPERQSAGIVAKALDALSRTR
jgi:hypothetical protein